MPITFVRRELEDTEGVDLADTEVDRQCRRWHQPAVEAWLCDNPFSTQKCRHPPLLD
jgi:hypothetical protein